jgi:AraC-like DNA-binding protein
MTVAPFTCFGVGVPPQPPRAAHTHEAHEFFICADDRGTQYAGRTAIPQKKGDLFCFPAGMPHYCSGSPRAGGYVFMIPDALFAPETYGDRDVLMALRRAIRLAESGTNPLPIGPRTSARVFRLARGMAQEFRVKAPGYQAAAKRLALDVFLSLLRDPGVGANQGGGARLRPADERMGRVVRFIDAHFMEQVTVPAMAEMAGMGRSRFHEEFRRATGCTLIDYVTRVRVRASQRLLRDTDARVLQVALDCGFPSLSRFYEAFKALTGATPGQVRRG